MGAIGWRKRQIEKAYSSDTGDFLREALREQIEEAERDQRHPPRPVHMNVDQLLKLSFVDVYLGVRGGKWTVEDFGIWGHTMEQFARKNK